MSDTALRRAAEDIFAHELAALEKGDDRERPTNWRMSPQVVVTYLLGGTAKDGTIITPKYVGNRRLTDLYEGGNAQEMLARAAQIVESGVNLIVLLALSDSGRSGFDEEHAKAFAAMGCPVFACTPDQFPDLIAAALKREDISNWAAARDIACVRG